MIGFSMKEEITPIRVNALRKARVMYTPSWPSWSCMVYVLANIKMTPKKNTPKRKKPVEVVSLMLMPTSLSKAMETMHDGPQQAPKNP